jgi:ATP-dependent DNA ligase
MRYAKRIQVYENFPDAADAARHGKQKYGFDMIQPKYDGWWACAQVLNGEARVYSRQGVLKATLPVDQSMVSCVIVGEFLVGTQRSKSDADFGKMIAFDVMEFGGKDIRQEQYRSRFRRLTHGALALCGYASWLHPSEEYHIRDHRIAWKWCVERDGAEGLIFRNSFHAYEDSVIGRVKQTFTMDYVVMDVLPGEGKHKGRMGALVCGLYEGRKLVEKVRVGGGWTDVERESIWKQPRTYIGRVLEVRGWQVFESGSMRHPNAVRFRDDKVAKDCVFNKKEVR